MADFSQPSQYEIFYIPKKNGKKRRIEAPKPGLKEQLKKDLEYFYNVSKVSVHAHGFIPDRDMWTGAASHVGKKYVLGMDILNFFPSITWTNFEKIIRKNPHLHLIDISHLEEFLNIAKRSFVKFKRDNDYRLAQGSPTSPWLSNVFLLTFDYYIANYIWQYLPIKENVAYTRYADDIAISGNDYDSLKQFFPIIRKVLNKRYGLRINNTKNRIIGRHRQQRVFGIVVNEKLNTPRKLRKNMRAALHQAKLGVKKLDRSTKGKIEWAFQPKKIEPTVVIDKGVIKEVKHMKTYIKLMEMQEMMKELNNNL